MILVPLFDLKFLNQRMNFKSAALKRIPIELNRSLKRPNQDAL